MAKKWMEVLKRPELEMLRPVCDREGLKTLRVLRFGLSYGNFYLLFERFGHGAGACPTRLN